MIDLVIVLEEIYRLAKERIPMIKLLLSFCTVLIKNISISVPGPDSQQPARSVFQKDEQRSSMLRSGDQLLIPPPTQLYKRLRITRQINTAGKNGLRHKMPLSIT